MRGRAALGVLASAFLAGCVTPGPGLRGSRHAEPAHALVSGDLLVAMLGGERQPQAGARLVRLRRSVDDDATPQVEALTVLETDGPIVEIASTGDGGWFATTVARGPVGWRVDLFRVRPGREPEAAWTSPPGCQSPSFAPDGAWMVVACAAEGRQPAWLLRLSLPDLRQLALVGERPRRSPAAGVEGDLYWAEEVGGRSVVMRRPVGAEPFAVHDVPGRVARLAPQADGRLIAVVDGPRRSRQLVELLPSGAMSPGALPDTVAAADLEGAFAISPHGEWLVVRCGRGPCSVLQAGLEVPPPLSLGGVPTAVSVVSALRGARTRPEDLATAPATVLASHLASDVAVLGVTLGTPLTEAFAVLDRAGLHPWWDTGGGRARPQGIGVGRALGAWCIEFESDERGLVAGVDLRDCAAPYLSPALRPLLNREALAAGALGVARRFLGPGVSVEVGDGAGGPGETRSHPVRRTRLSYDAPDRGYSFQSQTEILDARDAPLWDGWVWLRLETPGRRQTARRP